jgi:hypothetical protein
MLFAPSSDGAVVYSTPSCNIVDCVHRGWWLVGKLHLRHVGNGVEVVCYPVCVCCGKRLAAEVEELGLSLERNSIGWRLENLPDFKTQKPDILSQLIGADFIRHRVGLAGKRDHVCHC